MGITKEDVLSYISNLSVLELSELVKDFEEKFGVSAAPAVIAASGGAASGGAAVEEKTEFSVTIVNSGDKKINVIKVIREVTGLGLKEAKDASEQVPHVLKDGINKDEAEAIKKKLEEAGAKVEIK